MKRTEDEIMKDFDGLECELSPENLHCDGEASPAYVQQKLRDINRRWKDLEHELGRKVEEGDAYNYFRAHPAPAKVLGRPF